jgi:hypothetical protein
MILDTGLCNIYRLTNTAAAGDMPTETPELLAQLWYGELSFESSPIQNTESQENIEIAMRIRVLRTRNVCEKAVVRIGADDYQVERVYNGVDKESGELISDLSLTRRASIYDAG